MHRLILALLGAGLVSGLGFASALAQPVKAGDVAHGKQVFVADGCYQCHGYQGQGTGSAGPKLAPNPLPFDAVERQLRKPRDRMPVYTRTTMSDGDVTDVYAYLQSMPKARTVADIPMLSAVKP